MRIDFYLLKNMDLKQSRQYLCRLIDKIYQRKHRIYVHTDHEADAHQIDDLLWTFRDTSFIPHNLVGEGPDNPPPVRIGYQSRPESFQDILINLSAEVPDFYTDFKRVLEIVPSDDEAKAICREHYRFYKSHGAQLQMHEIT